MTEPENLIAFEPQARVRDIHTGTEYVLVAHFKREGLAELRDADGRLTSWNSRNNRRFVAIEGAG